MSRLSPAQRHFARVTAERSAAAAAPGGTSGGNAYELMLFKLAEDRRGLKQIQSIERKIEVKRALLPTYQDWVDGALAGGKGAQDDVLTTVLVWYIDIGDFPQALRIADYALAHKLTLPDQYNRDLATLLIDEVADAYLNRKADDPAPFPREVLQEVDRLTKERDAPDQARAKLHKALGYAFMDLTGDGDLAGFDIGYAEAANHHLHRALELFTGIGVKKDIERLERRLKKVAKV